LVWFLNGASADTMVVESLPTTRHLIHQAMGLTKHETQLKRVTARGRGVSHLTTHPHTHKVTHILSPFPDVPLACPPVAVPSQTTHLPLFEEPVLSGGDEVGPCVAALSGE